VYSVQCTVYSVQCTVYGVRCTVYSVQSTVYSVQCIVYSVQCTESRCFKRLDHIDFLSSCKCVHTHIYFMTPPPPPYPPHALLLIRIHHPLPTLSTPSLLLVCLAIAPCHWATTSNVSNVCNQLSDRHWRERNALLCRVSQSRAKWFCWITMSTTFLHRHTHTHTDRHADILDCMHGGYYFIERQAWINANYTARLLFPPKCGEGRLLWNILSFLLPVMCVEVGEWPH